MQNKEILHQIRQQVAQGNITERIHGHYSLFKYSRKCTYDKKWSKVTRRCRGIVFNNETGEIVSRSFDKFFNLGENSSTNTKVILGKATRMPFDIFEKLDGSMCALSHFGNEWQVSTPGSLESPQALYAKKLLSQYNVSNLDKQYTYACELIGRNPNPNCVVNYGDREELVLLAIFKKTWEPQEIFEVEKYANLAGFGVPRKFSYSFDNLLNVEIPENNEGYVIRFKDGLRIKIKSLWYCEVHKLISYLSEKNILQLLYEEKFDEIFQQLPEHIQEQADDIKGVLLTRRDNLEKNLEIFWSTVPNKSNIKECAQHITQHTPKDLQPLLFMKMREKPIDLWQHLLKQLRSKKDVKET